MASTALQLSLLSILLWAFALTSANPIDISVRLKRQTMRPWMVSEWSECSSTCGGGIRARSVRCLDEDEVIAGDCAINSRPVSHEFCNQVDCTTSVSDPNALPATGNYSLVSPDGSEHTVTFRVQDGGYTLRKNTVENDGSSSSISVTETDTITTTSTSLIGRNYVLGLGMQNGLTSFTADGNNLITLNDIESYDISSSASLSYSSNTISISDGGTFPNISTLYFYDGFLFYRFNTSKINSLSGPGVLYINRGVGLYSASVGLNSQLSSLIATVPTPLTETPEEVQPTDSVNTDPAVVEPSNPPSSSTPPSVSETSPSAGPTISPTTSSPVPIPSRPRPRPKPGTPQRPDKSKSASKQPREKSPSTQRPSANPESEQSGRMKEESSRESTTRENTGLLSRRRQNPDERTPSSPRSRKGRKSRPETSPMVRPQSRDQSIPQTSEQSPLARPTGTRQPPSTRRTRDERTPRGNGPHQSRSTEESPECETN